MRSPLNFDWIDERLAVGGRFPMEAAEQLARREGIGAIVDLRVESRDDEAMLRAHGLEFLHLPTEDCCA
ncbi:MAG: protein phosphatase, partial [Myxococcaceae bacterium]